MRITVPVISAAEKLAPWHRAATAETNTNRRMLFIYFVFRESKTVGKLPLAKTPGKTRVKNFTSPHVEVDLRLF